MCFSFTPHPTDTTPMLVLLLTLGCHEVSETDTDNTASDTDTDAPCAPEELCDGLDNDCDGNLAEGEEDADQDGLPDCWACAESGYWDLARDTPAENLSTELEAATDSVSCTYDASREYLFTALDNENGGVECVYTGQFFPIDTYPPDWDVVNTEHTWPQSKGADVDPARCDLHHLYPTDAPANTRRGNLPFGEVTQVEWSEGGSLQGEDEHGEDVFEPRDVHKGNVARSMLYFAVRYGYTLGEDQLALFAAWNEQDPVDTTEVSRSIEIRDQQGNANPFIVCDGLVERFTD